MKCYKCRTEDVYVAGLCSRCYNVLYNNKNNRYLIHRIGRPLFEWEVKHNLFILMKKRKYLRKKNNSICP